MLCASSTTAQVDPWSNPDSLEQHLDTADSLKISCHTRIANDSADEESWTTLYRLAKEEERFSTTLDVAQRCARLVGGYDCHYLLGDALLDNGFTAEAVDAIRLALQIEPTSVLALTMLSEAFDLRDEPDSSLLYIDRAIVLNPRYVQSHYQRADLLDRLGRYTEAIESYTAWANLQPFKPEPWIKLGTAHWAIGDYNEAIDILGYALEIGEESPEALFLIAASKQALGRTSEAKSAYVDIFFRFPSHHRAVDAEQRARELGWDPTGRSK